jgi:ketosteroid isomerase-like protein
MVDDHVATVRTFLRLLGERDIDSWIELWAENADHYYPFGTEMFPAHVTGRAAVYELWKEVPATFDTLDFTLRETWADGDSVIARFTGECVLKDGGSTYANNYLAIFKFESAGQIREYWEYFDPIVAGVGFGLAEIRYLAAAGANG